MNTIDRAKMLQIISVYIIKQVQRIFITWGKVLFTENSNILVWEADCYFGVDIQAVYDIFTLGYLKNGRSTSV